MDIQPQQQSRLDRILAKLTKQKALIEGEEKGSIEIHFSGKSETVTIKVVIQ